MKRNESAYIKKILSKIFFMLNVANSVWFAASYVEILIKNVQPNPQYCPYNFFIFLASL